MRQPQVGTRGICRYCHKPLRLDNKRGYCYLCGEKWKLVGRKDPRTPRPRITRVPQRYCGLADGLSVRKVEVVDAD